VLDVCLVFWHLLLQQTTCKRKSDSPAYRVRSNHGAGGPGWLSCGFA